MPENTPHLALQGFLVWMSLIVAIGPQNALVIRQGLLRRSVGAVIAVCMAGDVALVFGGTAGVGVLVDRAPVVLTVLRWVGVAFLLWFASTAVRDAVRPSGMTAGDGGTGALSCLCRAPAVPGVRRRVRPDPASGVPGRCRAVVVPLLCRGPGPQRPVASRTAMATMTAAMTMLIARHTPGRDSGPDSAAAP